MSANIKPKADARYISQRAANAIISEIGSFRMSTDALSALNTFMDEILLLLLQSSQSLDLSNIKAAINQLIPLQLGKNAVVEAELEVKTFTESGERIDYAVYERMRRLPDPFPIERVVPQFRDKIFYYCTLADKESVTTSRSPPPDNDPEVIVSPIVAIYVTAVMEHLAEYLLTSIARQTADADDTEFVRVKDVFYALVDDAQLGRLFWRTDIKDKLQKRLGAFSVQRPETPVFDPPPRPAPRRQAGDPDMSYFDADLDDLDFEATPNSGVQRTNTTASYSSQNSSSSGGKKGERLSVIASNRNSQQPQAYRPQSVLTNSPSNTSPSLRPSTPRSAGFGKIFKKGSPGGQYSDYASIVSGTSGSTSGDDESGDTMDFEQLIRSGQTMKVTLTPNRLRTIEVKEKASSKSTTSNDDPSSPPAIQERHYAQRVGPPRTSSGAVPPVPALPAKINGMPKRPDHEDNEEDISPYGERSQANGQYGSPPTSPPIQSSQSDTLERLKNLQAAAARGTNTNTGIAGIDRPTPPSPRAKATTVRPQSPSSRQLKPRSPVTVSNPELEKEEEDDSDLDDLLTDGHKKRQNRVSYMSEKADLMEFLRSTPPGMTAPPATAETTAEPSPHSRTERLNSLNKHTEIHIPKVESSDQMLNEKDAESPRVAQTEFNQSLGKQGIVNHQKHAGSVPPAVPPKHEDRPSTPRDESRPGTPSQRKVIPPPRRDSIPKSEAGINAAAAAAATGAAIVEEARKEMEREKERERELQLQLQQQQQQEVVESPKEIERKGSLRKNSEKIVDKRDDKDRKEVEEVEKERPSRRSERGSIIFDRPERPSSIVAKRQSQLLNRQSQSFENITISAKDLYQLRRQLTDAKSVENSVRVWDEFLHKNGGGSVRRRSAANRSTIYEDQELLDKLKQKDKDLDEGSGASGESEDGKGKIRERRRINRDSIVADGNEKTRTDKETNKSEKKFATKSPLSKDSAERSPTGSDADSANGVSANSSGNEMSVKTTSTKATASSRVAASKSVSAKATASKTTSSKTTVSRAAVSKTATSKPTFSKATSNVSSSARGPPAITVSVEDESGAVIEQDVELTSVATDDERSDNGIRDGDEVWYIDDDEEEAEKYSVEEMFVVEWLLGEGGPTAADIDNSAEATIVSAH